MQSVFIYDSTPRFVHSCVLSASRYTGKERDAESGLDYFGARYYGSSLGRWMSPDWSAKAEPVPYAKLDDPQSLNLYSYVKNNPLSQADPDGHDGCCLLEEAEEAVEHALPEVEAIGAGALAGGGEGAEDGAIAGTIAEPGGGTAVGTLIGGGLGILGGAYAGYETFKHTQSPTPATPSSVSPNTTPKPTNPAPPSPTAEHDKGARPSTKDKHEKRRPGTSPPPNYKPDRKFKQPKDDKKKDKKEPYVRKDRDKPAS